MAKLLTKNNIEELFYAFEHFFPEGYVYSSDKPFVSGNFKWNNRESFIESIKNFTGVEIDPKDPESIKNAQFALKKLEDDAPLDSNLPDQARLKQMEAERLKREAAIKASAEDAKIQVQAAIKRQEELHKTIQGKKIYRRVNTPPPETLTEDKAKTVETFKTAAVANPEQLTHQIASEIEERIKTSIPDEVEPEVVKALSTRAAVRVVENLRGKSLAVEALTVNKIAGDESVVGTVNPETTKLFINSAVNVGNTKIIEYQIDRKIVAAAFNEDFASNFLGPKDLDKVNIEFSLTPQAGFEEYDLGEVTTSQIDFLNKQDFVFDTIGSVGSGEIKSVFLKQVGSWIESSIPESGAVAEAYNTPLVQAALSYYGLGEPIAWEGTTFFGRMAVEFGYGPTFGWAGQITGIDFGVTQASASISSEVAAQAAAGTLSTEMTAAAVNTAAVGGGVAATEGAAVVGGVTAAAAEGAGAVVATGAVAAGGVAATETGVAAASVAAAPVTGGVSLAIGAAVGLITAIFGPKFLDWVSKNAKKVDGTSVALAGAFFGMVIGGGISGALIGASIGLGSFGLLTGGFSGVGSAFSGAATSIFGAFSAAWAILLAETGLPIISFLIGFPLLTALILVIINNSAYLVPPGGDSSLNSTNAYISVEKKAEPAGQVPSPTTVTYTVTITAKKDTLSGISFTATCSAIKKSGGTIDCKNLEQLPAPPASISPGAPYSFTFTSTYGSNFNDSLVSDSITVTASSNDGGEVSETGSASVCFGDCPLGCYKTVDNNEPWPANFKSNLDAAAATLSGSHPGFSQKACAGGEINMCYTTKSPNPIGSGGLCNRTIYAIHAHSGSCDINYNQCGLRSQSDALYILTHEVSHHIQNINGGLQRQFEQQVPSSEWPICTYSNTGNPYESMAEGNALFVGKPSWSGCVTNYQSQYPKHYQFAKNVMFAQ